MKQEWVLFVKTAAQLDYDKRDNNTSVIHYPGKSFR